MARPKASTDDLRWLIRQLGKIPAETRTELRKPLRKAGQQALFQARANASWSSRIPKAIRLSVSFAKRHPGVALVVNRKIAPHGRAYENLGQVGRFRHPVPNTRRWVAQLSRPYLFPAAESAVEQMDADIGLAVDAALRKHGFR